MSVVLRCPNCGTTRATPGDCEACHEAKVRYFCTNHTPGIWVDAPACPKCGARFGEVRKAPTPVTGPTRSSVPRPPAPTPAPSYPPRDLPGARADEWESPESPESLPRGGVRLPPGTSPIAMWLNILEAATRSRRPAPAPTPRRGGTGMGCGCFIQLVVLFVSLLLSALFMFGS